MSGHAAELAAFLAGGPQFIRVSVLMAKGSTPREQGAWMLVSESALFGTIGGGQLEFRAIAQARALLSGEGGAMRLELPLGPEIGQCCGGHVTLDFERGPNIAAGEIAGQLRAAEAAQPSVLLFGAGHVGHALARALALLPLNVSVVETRAEALAGLPEDINQRLTALPEEAVRDAPPGSAFIVMTHDHALDFLILGEVLRRGDFAYAGMIGSATKRETFRRWWVNEAGGEAALLERLDCPIGGTTADKRPAVIAALAAAVIMQAVTVDL